MTVDVAAGLIADAPTGYGRWDVGGAWSEASVHELVPAGESASSWWHHMAIPTVTERECDVDGTCGPWSEPADGWRVGNHYVDPYLVVLDTELLLGVDFGCGASPTTSFCSGVGEDLLACGPANSSSLCAGVVWQSAEAVLTDHCVGAEGLAAWETEDGRRIENSIAFLVEF